MIIEGVIVVLAVVRGDLSFLETISENLLLLRRVGETIDQTIDQLTFTKQPVLNVAECVKFLFALQGKDLCTVKSVLKIEEGILEGKVVETNFLKKIFLLVTRHDLHLKRVEVAMLW